MKPPSGPPNPDQVVDVGAAAVEAAVTVATLLTLVFFWLVEHARLQRYLLAYLPMDRRAGARDAWNEIETRLGLWVRGQLILMGVMGLATGIAYTLLGLPGALLLGLIAALTEAIPIIGPLLGAIPAVLVAATVSPELAVIVAGVYIVIQLIEGSVLVPLVMRNSVGISPLLVLLSLLVGGGGRRAGRGVPGGPGGGLARDRAVAAPGPGDAGRPGPGRDRDPRRGGPRRVRALAARRRASPPPSGVAARLSERAISRGPPPRCRATGRRSRSAPATPLRQPPDGLERGDRGQVDERRRIGRLEPMTGRSGGAMEDVALAQDLDVILPLDRHPAVR